MTLAETTPQLSSRLVNALHSCWTGTLELTEDGRVRHTQHGSQGDYFLAEPWLLVRWDDWPSDLFSFDGENFVHLVFNKRPGHLDASQPQTFVVADQDVAVHSLVVNAPKSGQLIELRPGMSDISVYQAIFVEHEYQLPIPVEPLDTIVDLGANIGLSALFFSNRFPSARIVAVEPEPGNFAMLCRNARQSPTIIPVCAAIWNSDTTVSIATEQASGARFDAWGYQTREPTHHTIGSGVEALTLLTLMRRCKLRTIDLLKIDIEGAEFELFATGTESWLPYVRMIVIETHERFRAGVDSLVTSRLASDFIEQPSSGENRVFLRRANAPLRGMTF